MHFQVKVTEVAGLWLYCCCCVFSSAEMLEGKKKPKKKKRKKKEQNKCIKLPFCFSSLPSQSGMIFYPKAPPCIFSFSFAFKLLAFRITMAGSCAWCIGVLPKPVPLISFERERERRKKEQKMQRFNNSSVLSLSHLLYVLEHGTRDMVVECWVDRVHLVSMSLFRWVLFLILAY